MNAPIRTRGFAGRAVMAVSACGLLAATALSGCSDPQTDSAPAATGPVVEVAGMAYSPATLTVDTGTTVTWEFNDRGIAHDVTGVGTAESVLGSPLMKTGTFTFTFDEPGTYDYTCSLHPDMQGTIVVR